MHDKTTETPVFHDDTIERLRAWAALADKQADEHATRGGEARALANQHLADAARHDELAAQERAIADERRWLLAVAEATRPVEVPAAPSAPEPVQLVTPQDAARSLLPAGVGGWPDPSGSPCPAGCGQPVFPGPNGVVHRVEGGTAAACPPHPGDDPTPTRAFPLPVLDVAR